MAVELARRETLGGLSLQSTFTSIPDIGAELVPWLPVRFLATIRYDNLAKIGQLQLPLLILHSRADRLIPFEHGRRLYAAAAAPRLFRNLPPLAWRYSQTQGARRIRSDHEGGDAPGPKNPTQQLPVCRERGEQALRPR